MLASEWVQFRLWFATGSVVSTHLPALFSCSPIFAGPWHFEWVVTWILNSYWMSIQVTVSMLDFKFKLENYKDENWRIFSPNWYCIFNLFGTVEAFAPIWNPFTYFSFFHEISFSCLHICPRNLSDILQRPVTFIQESNFHLTKVDTKYFVHAEKVVKFVKFFAYLQSKMEKNVVQNSARNLIWCL